MQMAMVALSKTASKLTARQQATLTLFDVVFCQHAGPATRHHAENSLEEAHVRCKTKARRPCIAGTWLSLSASSSCSIL
jgi:hypothetical protein